MCRHSNLYLYYLRRQNKRKIKYRISNKYELYVCTYSSILFQDTPQCICKVVSPHLLHAVFHLLWGISKFQISPFRKSDGRHRDKESSRKWTVVFTKAKERLVGREGNRGLRWFSRMVISSVATEYFLSLVMAVRVARRFSDNADLDKSPRRPICSYLRLLPASAVLRGRCVHIGRRVSERYYVVYFVRRFEEFLREN